MSDSEAVKEIVIFESKDRRCCRGYKWSNHRLNYFIENTTINGLVYVFKSDSKIRRIIWGIIFCCALISCTIVIGYSVMSQQQQLLLLALITVYHFQLCLSVI